VHCSLLFIYIYIFIIIFVIKSFHLFIIHFSPFFFVTIFYLVIFKTPYVILHSIVQSMFRGEDFQNYFILFFYLFLNISNYLLIYLNSYFFILILRFFLLSNNFYFFLMCISGPQLASCLAPPAIYNSYLSTSTHIPYSVQLFC